MTLIFIAALSLVLVWLVGRKLVYRCPPGYALVVTGGDKGVRIIRNRTFIRSPSETIEVLDLHPILIQSKVRLGADGTLGKALFSCEVKVRERKESLQIAARRTLGLSKRQTYRVVERTVAACVVRSAADVANPAAALEEATSTRLEPLLSELGLQLVALSVQLVPPEGSTAAS